MLMFGIVRIIRIIGLAYHRPQARYVRERFKQRPGQVYQSGVPYQRVAPSCYGLQARWSYGMYDTRCQYALPGIRYWYLTRYLTMGNATPMYEYSYV